jgi:hypothetical protein
MGNLYNLLQEKSGNSAFYNLAFGNQFLKGRELAKPHFWRVALTKRYLNLCA